MGCGRVIQALCELQQEIVLLFEERMGRVATSKSSQIWTPRTGYGQRSCIKSDRRSPKFEEKLCVKDKCANTREGGGGSITQLTQHNSQFKMGEGERKDQLSRVWLAVSENGCGGNGGNGLFLEQKGGELL
jgi:hypothetical protein